MVNSRCRHVGPDVNVCCVISHITYIDSCIITKYVNGIKLQPDISSNTCTEIAILIIIVIGDPDPAVYVCVKPI